MPRLRMTVPQARRVALAAQGFTRPRPSGPVTTRNVTDTVRRLSVIQIDSVNVLARAQYLPVFSRLGGYDRGRLDRAAGVAPRALFEYWGHEAALLPVALQPLMRWRMARAHEDAWGGMTRINQEQPGLVREVAELVRALGPLTSTELESALEHEEERSRDDWGWNWSAVKRALEYLFWAGEITSAGRDSAFRRRYAVPEAVLPRTVLDAPTPSRASAQRELVRIAAGALGVATAADLADYFRLPVPQARTAIDSLLSDGELVAIDVDGWPAAFGPPGVTIPRRVDAAALLAPFDPLIWFRPRTERLFGMRYRIEIYTPAAKRVHGYYVLPFLHGEHLVARVDLKADRAGGRLLVQAAHPEGEVSPAALSELAAELARTAEWLGLDRVEVAPVGLLATELASVVRSAPD